LPVEIDGMRSQSSSSSRMLGTSAPILTNRPQAGPAGYVRSLLFSGSKSAYIVT
jgi:hypothetical protein